jgi:hypothetical protein
MYTEGILLKAKAIVISTSMVTPYVLTKFNGCVINIVTWKAHHSVNTPPPTVVFLHAVPSRAEAHWLLRSSKQFWQRCLTTPVNMTSDNRRAV